MTAEEYREIRNSLKLKQSQLAEKLGVALNTVSRRELGQLPITREAEMAVLKVVGQGFYADVGELRLFSQLDYEGWWAAVWDRKRKRMLVKQWADNAEDGKRIAVEWADNQLRRKLFPKWEPL
jgi:transcriptional regulator with XRE-family HTH domain